MPAYVLWNNKGGVGKSTLTFQLACMYARVHPNTATYVIDLSPQCDVSRMLLGGGCYNGEAAILGLMQANPRATVQGYLEACLNDVPTGNGWPNPTQYIVDPNTFRHANATHLPQNIKLLCGDFDLERITQRLEQLPQPPGRGGRIPTGPEYSVNLLIRSFLRKLVETVEAENGGSVSFFIDTDPYYDVVTTHMGLLAADRWITAYTPGSQASQYAVYRSLEFLHDPQFGLDVQVQQQLARYPFPWYDNRGRLLQVPQMVVPPLYALLSNMTTPYSSGRAPYTTPQQLHQATITQVQAETTRRNGNAPPVMTYLWDLQRLGLICDFNGMDISQLQLGQRYPLANRTATYPLIATGGTPAQLAGYRHSMRSISAML